jgi:hypothetical protein
VHNHTIYAFLMSTNPPEDSRSMNVEALLLDVSKIRSRLIPIVSSGSHAVVYFVLPMGTAFEPPADVAGVTFRSRAVDTSSVESLTKTLRPLFGRNGCRLSFKFRLAKRDKR